jgi:hypothetical protein
MAYRQRMTEYHPDKVAHLGAELRELAEREATEFNLARKYIEKGIGTGTVCACASPQPAGKRFVNLPRFGGHGKLKVK